MSNNELMNNQNNELEFKKIKIDDMYKVADYLFIVLSNGQKVLTNGKELYDVSEYSGLMDLFFMEEKLCAVLTKEFSKCVVELKTMEVLFEDKEVSYVIKKDDRTLYIMKKIGKGNDKIYNIKEKKYIPIPANYEFEQTLSDSLSDSLYVFRESNDDDIDFYDYKRCIMNANGKVIMKNIEGWIFLSSNHRIITKKRNELCIIEIDEKSELNIKTIKQNKEIIAPPDYYDENIMIIVTGAIKIYTPSFELIKEIKIEELKEVLQYQIVSNILKLCLPHTINGEQINKHLFVNLNTGKSISHIRIEGYPYWYPTTFIGKDTIDTKITNYHFYNKEFEPIINVNATSYEGVDTDKECMFVIKTLEDNTEKKKLINTELGIIREINYDVIKFPVNHQDGYGIDFTTGKIDFFDEKLEMLIPNFDYKKYDLNIYDFGYFIVNDYICVINHFIDSYGKSRDEVIIQNKNGDTILDSINHRCYALGNFIQIMHNKESEFLNTLTGEIGPLSISAKVDETGKIDLKRINNMSTFLTTDNNTRLSIPTADDNISPKIKKLKNEQQKPDYK